jgi:hypothetical protein
MANSPTDSAGFIGTDDGDAVVTAEPDGVQLVLDVVHLADELAVGQRPQAFGDESRRLRCPAGVPAYDIGDGFLNCGIHTRDPPLEREMLLQIFTNINYQVVKAADERLTISRSAP